MVKNTWHRRFTQINFRNASTSLGQSHHVRKNRLLGRQIRAHQVHRSSISLASISGFQVNALESSYCEKYEHKGQRCTDKYLVFDRNWHEVRTNWISDVLFFSSIFPLTIPGRARWTPRDRHSLIPQQSTPCWRQPLKCYISRATVLWEFWYGCWAFRVAGYQYFRNVLVCGLRFYIFHRLCPSFFTIPVSYRWPYLIGFANITF